MLLEPSAQLEKLWTGSTWGEGPVWLADRGVLLWSDIPGDRILEFDAGTGLTRTYRDGVEFTNGRTLDREGRIIQCSHGRRRVEYEVDGDSREIVDRFGPHRFNSPNDVVVASDGAIWFTDPPYGILDPREGHPGEMEYGGCFVFRFDPADGSLVPVVTDLPSPNGLAFSPDESILYVTDTVDDERGVIRAYDVDVRTGVTARGRDFGKVDSGMADGIRVDVAGRMWSSSGNGIVVYSAGGEELLKVPVPEPVANLCFGGIDGRDLYISAATSLYRIRTLTTAAGRGE